MKEVNIIAILGFFLICSPQAFGQNNDYIGSRLVIESPKDTRLAQDKTFKIYPFQEEKNLTPSLSFSKNSKISASEIGVRTTKPVIVNFRQFVRPKIIEENIA
jgi:hypothetical protein